MADQGVGVFVITHDLELALQTADRILIFYEGTVAEELQMAEEPGGKTPRTLAAPPSHPYARRLFDAVPGRENRGGRKLGGRRMKLKAEGNFVLLRKGGQTDFNGLLH